MIAGVENLAFRLIDGDPGYRIDSEGGVWTRLCPIPRKGNTAGGWDYVPGDTWRKLKPTPTTSGHLTVRIRRRIRRVHRLVLEAFVGPCPPGMECCHNDGDILNNRLANLRWDTRQSNMEDQIRHGVRRRGRRMVNAKMSESTVREVRAEYARCGISLSAMGRKHGVAAKTIQDIVTRRRWKHVE